MTSVLLTKDETGTLKPSQLKPYRNAFKLVYANPEFKAAYKQETIDTILRMLSYIDIIRIKGEEVLTDTDDAMMKYITKQFVNNNIESVKKLSSLPIELQPSRESIETITKISLI